MKVLPHSPLVLFVLHVSKRQTKPNPKATWPEACESRQNGKYFNQCKNWAEKVEQTGLWRLGGWAVGRMGGEQPEVEK